MKYSEKEIEAFTLYTNNNDIAKAIGKSTRTVINLKKDKNLQKEVKERRKQALECSLNKLQGGLNGAIDVLNGIIQDCSIKPQIRLNAISYLLNACKPMIESYYEQDSVKYDVKIESDPLSKALEELGGQLESDLIED